MENITVLLFRENFIFIPVTVWCSYRMFSSLVEASLLSAAKSGHHKVVALILRGSNVNVNVEDGEGDTPLTSASLRGHREVVNLLLKEKGIEVKVENYH